MSNNAMDNTKKFSGRASDYTVGRPAYAAEFIDYLYTAQNLSEESIIADIGSGTGKFTKQLLLRGSFVYGVEPNEDMRNTAIAELGRFEKYRAVNGTASDTMLANEAVDFITVAQAFHWFDAELFHRECARILRPNGKIFLIWNMRDMDAEVNQESYKIYTRFCPKFRGFAGGMKKDDDRIRQFFNDKYETVIFDYSLHYDKDKFISRSLSGSYSLQEGDAHYEEYIGALTELFDRYSSDGMMQVANQTVAYVGNV